MRIRSRLRMRAGSIVRDDALADDIVQESFVRLWDSKLKADTEPETEAVLHTTVRNLSIDNVRREATHPRAPEEALETMASESDSENEKSAEVFREVDALVRSRLSERDREILYLRDRNGWDFDEIAAKCGLSEANVRMIVSRSRKTIRNLYLNGKR